jgi:hypothetical protein
VAVASAFGKPHVVRDVEETFQQNVEQIRNQAIYFQSKKSKKLSP